MQSERNSEEGLTGLLDNRYVPALILILVALVCYANSLQVPFVLDDDSSITENQVIRSLANFLPGGSGYASGPNRFVGSLSFALNYAIGGLSVTGYHIINLAIHIANALLVYALVRLTFLTPFFKSRASEPSTGNPELRAFIPLFAALLFVAHPLQTQAVTYVVQRFTSLTTLFYLAALVFHIRWRLGREESAPFSSQSVLPFYILSLVSALLAMKSKEIAITLPLAVMLYEVCFVGFPGRRRILEVLPMLLTLVVIPLSTLNISKPLGEILSDVGSATAVQSGLSRWDYLFTQFSVIVKYLRLLLLPVGQNMDYFLDYPLNRSLSEPRALLSLLLLLTLSGSALWMYYRGERRGARGEEIKLQSLDPEIRLAAFGIFWFFLTISLESSIIPIIDVYFEHRVYLPSVGFFIAVAALAVVGVRRFPQTAKVTCALAAVVVVLLSGATIARNQIWRDPVALWQDVKAKAPGNSRAYSNLGKAYSMRKMYHQAAKEYEAALTINPDSAEAFNNLGRTFLDLGQPGEALPLLRQALTLKSEYPAASFNMGLASVAVGNMTDAAEAFAAALRQLPQSYVYRNNLAVVLLKLGRLDEAEQEFRTLLLSRPNDPGIHGPLQEIERLRRTGNRERKYDADRKK